VVAIQEERLTGKKRSRIRGAVPSLAVRYCLEYAELAVCDLDLVVLSVQGRSYSSENDISSNPLLRITEFNIPVVQISHHMGHAMHAYCTSGFPEAAVLIVDGMGSPFEDLSEDEKKSVTEQVRNGWETISLYRVRGNSVSALEKHLVADGAWLIDRGTSMPLFGSIGGMYSSVATQIFGDAMEAGKVMGLAPYGNSAIDWREFFSIEQNGVFRFYDRVPARFEHDKRWPKLTAEYQDLASSVQTALEIAILHLVEKLYQRTESPNLCYAGGVALNGVTNERIMRESSFTHVFIPPAAEDSGVAVGAAYYGLWHLTGNVRTQQYLDDSPGAPYSSKRVEDAIAHIPLVQRSDVKDMMSATVDILCDGGVIGWYQGGSELGPRALGQRSILCDPRLHNGKELLNSGIKFRESFRPFAPAVLLEHAQDWFSFDKTTPSSPFMLRVCPFQEELRRLVPAVVHVDGTGRLQTVTSEGNPMLYELIQTFYNRTGIPMLLNTSFNISGEPLVETPEDAIWCFLSTALRVCVMGRIMVIKKPEFPSILDLRPQLACILPRSLDSNEYETHRALVKTPWGQIATRLSADFVSALKLIDGVGDGWRLLGQLRRNSGISETACTCLLARMRRAGLIRFLLPQ
jgi:carbamoyltransferase